MSLLDALFGQQAQVPGATQQPSGLQQLFSPEVAMPVAAQLLGNQGNAANFGNALGAYGQVKAQTAAKNKTMDFFRSQAPEYAQMVDAGLPLEEAWKSYTQRKYAQKGQGIVNAGGGNLYDSTTGKWLSAPGGGAEGIAGLQPVWLQSEDGTPVLGQMTKDGKVIRSQIESGLTPVGPYQKSFETQRGGAEGKVVGEAAGALPGVTQMATNINSQVEDLKSDPYLPNMLGPVDSRLPNVSTDAARVQGKLNQLQGGAFLQARQMLKGGGAITDYEGQKAEGAYARLNQAQTPEDFKAALDEFNFYVQQGLAKLQQQAGQQRMGGGYPGQQPAPQGGSVDYKSKYGLD